jgi:hypothetical protein
LKKPIDAMTKTPFGEDFLAPVWIGAVWYTYRREDCRELFKQETGIDISEVVKAKGLEAMVDRATGFQAEAIAKWADWVTVNFWGVEEETS